MVETVMQTQARIEQALETAIANAADVCAPPLFAEALRYAVFPGGHRIRPHLCLAVALACGDSDPAAADAAASAIELLHCASLVHDDLPCFDDAGLRRGKPSLHIQFGVPLGILVGDALIVLAFETMVPLTSQNPARWAQLTSIIARAVGSPRGIVAGQAWECESAVSLFDYQRAKTAALFVGATQAGAAAAGADFHRWRAVGEKLGEAYQIADDLRDILCDSKDLGKPIGQDAARLRPNAAAQLGFDGAKARLKELVNNAVASIPDCPGASELQTLIKFRAGQFLPVQLGRVAA
jgi:geranylgeranyl diphosphate synthase type II